MRFQNISNQIYHSPNKNIGVGFTNIPRGTTIDGANSAARQKKHRHISGLSSRLNIHPQKLVQIVYKLFGIGLPRTGTTSLSKALRTLGYKGENYCMLSGHKEKDEHNFFEVNNSFYSCYKKLFTENGNSMFILTTRDSASWKASVSNFQTTHRKLPNINEYTQNVMKFFNDRGALNQLLVVNLFDKGCDCACKWKNLYGFLRPPPPKVLNADILGAFPHV